MRHPLSSVRTSTDPIRRTIECPECGARFSVARRGPGANALGAEVHDRLRAAFKANRVRYTAPRKGRTLSAEERAVLVERLNRARQAAKQA